MPSETENKRKALKEELDHIERELTGTISIRVAAQFTNHMCDATFEKIRSRHLIYVIPYFSCGKLRNHYNKSYPFLFLLTANWLTVVLLTPEKLYNVKDWKPD